MTWRKVKTTQKWQICSVCPYWDKLTLRKETTFLEYRRIKMLSIVCSSKEVDEATDGIRN